MTFAVTGRPQDRKRSGLVRNALRGLVVAALIGLVLLSRTSPERFDGVRLAAQRAAAPMVWVYDAPVRTGRDIVQFFASYLRAHDENAALRQQMLDSVVAQRRLEVLENENFVLRKQLKVADWPADVVASGRVLSHGGGTYLKSVLVGSGFNDGVRQGQAAVSKAGLVGQVVAVSRHMSRVLVINDFSSRIPVIIHETETPAIAQGTNDAELDLSFLPIDAQPREGALVSTSGAGGLFPAGIPIGQVRFGVSGPEGTALHLVPFADLSAAGYLTFLSGRPEELLDQAPLPDQLASQLSGQDNKDGR